MALDDLTWVDFESLVEDTLYRNLGKLHPRRAGIELALVGRERTLFNLDHPRSSGQKAPTHSLPSLPQVRPVEKTPPGLAGSWVFTNLFGQFGRNILLLSRAWAATA